MFLINVMHVNIMWNIAVSLSAISSVFRLNKSDNFNLILHLLNPKEFS